MDLISIIVPVYKVEPYLDRCVQSIVDQTYSNLEIILIDDGSPDKCPQMCDAWAQKDSRIRVIHKENGGLSDARNAGIQEASGEYIAFVDSDDWLENAFIENLHTAIDQNDCEVAGCRFFVTKGEHANSHYAGVRVARIVDRVTAMGDLIDDRIRQVVWNKLYKTNLIKQIPFEKGKCHEDEFWSYQVFGKLTRYVETEYVGYNYLQRPDSIMGEAYTLKRLDVVEAIVRRQRYLEENMKELSSIGRINIMFTCLWHGQAAFRFLDSRERQIAFQILKKVSAANCLSQEEKKTLKRTHRIWAFLADHLFEVTCWIRNALAVGL